MMLAPASDVLVDSSGWIQLLRRHGDVGVRDKLRHLMLDGRAVWCNVVQLELWRGASSDSDRKAIRDLSVDMRSLEISEKVWKTSYAIAGKCRPKGIIVPTTDLLIYACAKAHEAELFHKDRHFELLDSLDLN